MLKLFKYRKIGFLILLFAISCKDPYYPELKPEQTSYLVVEGNIDPGNSPAEIRLSRTVPINDSAKVKPELNASLEVEGEDNSTYPLQETGNGLYTAGQLHLNLQKKYRLKINTANGKSYVSDFIALKQTPPVEVGWQRGADGVHLHFSTEDPQNNTHYYKWNYEETWEIHSHYEADFKYESTTNTIVSRDTAEIRKMLICWVQNNPSAIQLISTLALTRDVIDKQEIVFVPSGDEKLDIRYSILVKQYALDKSGYEFYQLMKKNTESLGTLFDPQPSEISGNVHNLNDAGEKVIGFITGSTVEEKRMFINRAELPDWTFIPNCVTVEVKNSPIDLQSYFFGEAFIPYGMKGRGEAYYGVNVACADCRMRGTNNRPVFW